MIIRNQKDFISYQFYDCGHVTVWLELPDPPMAAIPVGLTNVGTFVATFGIFHEVGHELEAGYEAWSMSSQISWISTCFNYAQLEDIRDWWFWDVMGCFVAAL